MRYLGSLEKITRDCRYFNEVHHVWLWVPAFWVGDWAGNHTDKIRREHIPTTKEIRNYTVAGTLEA